MPEPHNIPITVADMLIEVTSPLSAGKLGIKKQLGPFFGRRDDPDYRVALRWEESDTAPAPLGELIYDPGPVWAMYRSGHGFSAAINYAEKSSLVSAQAVLRANAAWDDLTLVEQPSGADWQSVLNIGAGELLLRTSILRAGGLVLHASGVDDHGRGIVFVGHSGAGKSTQLGLWRDVPGVVVVNDDRIALRVNGCGAMCYSTPWGDTADIAHPHSAPLSAIILMENAQENDIQPLSRSAAAPLLAACAFLPYWDASLVHRSLANLDSLLAQVPVYHLRWRPEPAVRSVVRSVL